MLPVIGRGFSLSSPRAATNETGERGGVSPPIDWRPHRGADAPPLAGMSHGRLRY